MKLLKKSSKQNEMEQDIIDERICGQNISVAKALGILGDLEGWQSDAGIYEMHLLTGIANILGVENLSKNPNSFGEHFHGGYATFEPSERYPGITVEFPLPLVSMTHRYRMRGSEINLRSDLIGKMEVREGAWSPEKRLEDVSDRHGIGCWSSDRLCGFVAEVKTLYSAEAGGFDYTRAPDVFADFKRQADKMVSAIREFTNARDG